MCRFFTINIGDVGCPMSDRFVLRQDLCVKGLGYSQNFPLGQKGLSGSTNTFLSPPVVQPEHTSLSKSLSYLARLFSLCPYTYNISLKGRKASVLRSPTNMWQCSEDGRELAREKYHILNKTRGFPLFVRPSVCHAQETPPGF